MSTDSKRCIGFDVTIFSPVSTDTADVFTITDITTNIVSQGEIHIYPNPATNTVNLKAPVLVNAMIYTIDGKLLIDRKDAHEIDINGLASGVYMIMVYDENNVLLKTERLIKME